LKINSQRIYPNKYQTVTRVRKTNKQSFSRVILKFPISDSRKWFCILPQWTNFRSHNQWVLKRYSYFSWRRYDRRAWLDNHIAYNDRPLFYVVTTSHAAIDHFSTRKVVYGVVTELTSQMWVSQYKLIFTYSYLNAADSLHLIMGENSPPFKF